MKLFAIQISKNKDLLSTFGGISTKTRASVSMQNKEGVGGEGDKMDGSSDDAVDLTTATSNWFSDVGGKLYGAASKLADDLDKLDDQLGEQMENAAKAVAEKAAEAKSKLDEAGGVSNFIGVSGMNLTSPRDTTDKNIIRRFDHAGARNPIPAPRRCPVRCLSSCASICFDPCTIPYHPNATRACAYTYASID